MVEKNRTQPPAWIRFIFWVCLLILLSPLLVLFCSSIIEQKEGQWSVSTIWYEQVFSNAVLWQAFLRSLLVASISALVASFLGLMAAFSMIKLRARSAAWVETFSAISLSLPELILALSLISWFALVGLKLSLSTVIIAHITLVLPFSTMIISARLRALDLGVEDAARDLGASEVQVFTKIIIPQLTPALVNAYILSFLLSLDDFLASFFTNGAGQDTLPVVLYSMMRSGLSPVLTALSVLILLLSAILCSALLILQKRT